MARHLPVDADPDSAYHLDADPDPAYHFDADPDPTYQFDADPEQQHWLAEAFFLYFLSAVCLSPWQEVK